MQIGYSRATNASSISLTQSGSGGSIATSPSTDLLNGRPQDVTRLIWETTPASGARAVTDFMTLDFEFPSPGIVPGIIGLLGFNAAPAGSTGVATDSGGISIQFFGRRVGDAAGTYPYNLGGTSQSQTTYVRDDGATHLICVLPTGLTACVGFRMKIFNNQRGNVIFVPGQAVDLGDFWVSPSVEVDIDGDWDLAYPEDKTPVSVDNQPWPRPYPPGRVFTGHRSLLPFTGLVKLPDNPNGVGAFVSVSGPSWQKLRTLCGNGQSSMFIPRWRVDGTLSTVNQSYIDSTAVMGIAKFSKIQRAQAGDVFDVSFTLSETPLLSA